jgi:regulator of CtrA degradation
MSAFSDNTVAFGHKLASSDAFKALFREGMLLVEEAAEYLDGPGRQESRALARAEALAYASESMRLTTRLMQLASWLLLQRAVNEGELSLAQAASDKHKVKLSRQEAAAEGALFQRLPVKLQDLVQQSLRLQERVLHLDQLLYGRKPEAPAPLGAMGVEAQFAQLRRAFSQTPQG